MLLDELFLGDREFVTQQKILQRILMKDIDRVQRFRVHFEIETKFASP